MASVEEQVEDFFKKQLSEFGIEYQTKTESINRSIDDALSNYCSKSGGSGKNYPDIKLLLTSNHARSIPVMIEAKGTKGDLIKYARNSTEIELVTEYSSDSGMRTKTGHILLRLIPARVRYAEQVEEISGFFRDLFCYVSTSSRCPCGLKLFKLYTWE